MNMAHSLLMALGLMLVVEGLLPFLSPSSWRETMLRVAQFKDGQLRFLGLGSILVGLLFLTFFS